MPAASNPERKTMQVALTPLLLLFQRGPRLSTRRGCSSIPFPFTPDMAPSSGSIIYRFAQISICSNCVPGAWVRQQENEHLGGAHHAVDTGERIPPVGGLGDRPLVLDSLRALRLGDVAEETLVAARNLSRHVPRRR